MIDAAKGIARAEMYVEHGATEDVLRATMARLCHERCTRWPLDEKDEPCDPEVRCTECEIEAAAVHETEASRVRRQTAHRIYKGIAGLKPAPTPSSQASAMRVPDGWRLVPEKPTRDMCDAALVALSGPTDFDPKVAAWDSIRAYKAMLAAAPALAPAADDGGLREAASYLIWSNEHRAWWRPDECGYTLAIEQAGRYDRRRAIDIASRARGGWARNKLPPEIALPEADAIEMATSPMRLEAYRTTALARTEGGVK